MDKGEMYSKLETEIKEHFYSRIRKLFTEALAQPTCLNVKGIRAARERFVRMEWPDGRVETIKFIDNILAGKYTIPSPATTIDMKAIHQRLMQATLEFAPHQRTELDQIICDILAGKYTISAPNQMLDVEGIEEAEKVILNMFAGPEEAVDDTTVNLDEALQMIGQYSNLIRKIKGGKYTIPAQPVSLSPSEALYGFAGWLTTRRTPLTMGSDHECAIVGELVKKFCEANELPEPLNGWWKKLSHPPDEPISSPTPHIEIDLEEIEKKLKYCTSTTGSWNEYTGVVRNLLAQLHAGATVKPVYDIDVEKWAEKFITIYEEWIQNCDFPRDKVELYRETTKDLLSAIRKSQEGKGWVVIKTIETSDDEGEIIGYGVLNTATMTIYTWEGEDYGTLWHDESEAQAKCDELNGAKTTCTFVIKPPLPGQQYSDTRGDSVRVETNIEDDQPDQDEGGWIIRTLDDQDWLFYHSVHTINMSGIHSRHYQTILDALNKKEKEK